MKNIINDINIHSYKKQVFKRFKELCGFFENREIDKDRIEEAVWCFDKYFDYFNVKTIYSFYNKDVFEKNNIHINKNISDKFKESDIYGYIIFALQAYCQNKINEKSVLKEFYFDVTGTAIVDSVRNILKYKFSNDSFNGNNNFFVSDSFGIGFFGIENKEIFRFSEIIDCNKIDIFISESGVMKPDKSFIGFFTVSKKEIIVKNCCESCIGNRKNCFLCVKY